MKRKGRPAPWTKFEDEVAAYVAQELRRGNLGLRVKRARLKRPAQYWARDSKKFVKFEIAIELLEPKNPNPTMVWIWECKHYAKRKVRVRDVRKFADELGQLEIPVKGLMVTPIGYQEGAARIANSRGIAIWTLTKHIHYRVGLWGKPPVDYVDVHYLVPGGRNPETMATVLHRECFAKAPPRRKRQRRRLLELG